MSAVKMEDCKRNSSIHVARSIHKLEKEFEKAGLANYSFDLRQKLESSLHATFREIGMNDASSSSPSQSQESRVAAAISNPPVPCSPYYVAYSPSFAYSSYSPGNVSCSPYYTPSSPLYNPYHPCDGLDCSPPQTEQTVTEETTPSSLSSKSKRLIEGDLDRDADSKKIKLENVNEEVKEDDFVEENIDKETATCVGSGKSGVEIEEEDV